MKQNKIENDTSNLSVLQRQIALLERSIAQTKDKLIGIVGEGQVEKIVKSVKDEGKKSLHEVYAEKSMEETMESSKKKMNVNKNIEDVLSKI